MKRPDLLAEFRRNPSEPGFAELVRRQTNFVYAIAHRRLGNVALAEEVVQVVFIRLARTAPRLQNEGELLAWLHRTTINASIDLWRAESRRRRREELAVAMQPNAADPPASNDLAVVIDAALDELPDADRQALLLRYFHDQPMRVLGSALGVSEDAAKMRVSRALERLRARLAPLGVACTAAALTAWLEEHAAGAAPAALADALARLRFSAPVGLGGLAVLVKFIGGSATGPVAAGLAVLLVGAGLWLGLRHFRPRGGAGAGVSGLHGASGAGAEVAAGGATNATEGFAESGAVSNLPDAVRLLHDVVSARSRVKSGSTDWLIAVERLQNGQPETNEWNVSIQFTDGRVRSDQYGREYRYTGVGEAGEAQAARMEQEQIGREAAVRLGLLQPFDSRLVSVYDGDALMIYRASDWTTARRNGSTQVQAAGHGGGGHLFDPRCIGLSFVLYEGTALETCMGFREARTIALAGREEVDGIAAWHVRVLTRYDEWLSFWFDVEHPTRVLKVQSRSETMRSKYESRIDDVPIPTEVMHLGGAKGRTITVTRVRYLRRNARLDAPIDPAVFTLAGLDMELGTSVTDVRNHRALGYWNGAGLSPFPPSSRQSQEPRVGPDVGQLLAAMDNDPGSDFARQSAQWILENTPDGPVVEQAARVILDRHLRDTNAATIQLCERLEATRPRCSTNLLEGFLRENPDPVVRGTACFLLAGLHKDAAGFGTNVAATAAAMALYERVIAEFSEAGPKGVELARKSRPALNELRHLVIGRPAPETRGEDLEGVPVSLGDLRGRIVVLVFWTESTDSDRREIQKIRDRFPREPIPGKPPDEAADLPVRQGLAHAPIPSLRAHRTVPARTGVCGPPVGVAPLDWSCPDRVVHRLRGGVTGRPGAGSAHLP